MSQPEAKKYIEAICVPLGFIEGRSPLIVGLEYDRTDSRVLVHRLTELISEIDNEKSEAIVSRDNRAAFLANISHDLRSPLNAVIGFSELLQSAESDEEREEYSAIINSSAEALLKLINDLLDLSRFEAGRIKFTKENFDLSQLCKEVHAALKAKITNPDIVFTLSLPCEHLVVYFDRVRMSQILTNFSTNAIKFTKHGKIDMGCEIVGQQVKLYVRDNGCGIPEADQHKVFERFERFNRSEPGTGLGLYICKTIAEEAGGEIGFESVEDHGSIFWVLIPCSPNTLLSDR